MKRMFLEFESHRDGELNNDTWKNSMINALCCTAVKKCIRPHNLIEFYIDADESEVFSRLNKSFKCPIEIRMFDVPSVDSPATYYTVEEGKTDSIEFWGIVFIKDKKDKEKKTK